MAQLPAIQRLEIASFIVAVVCGVALAMNLGVASAELKSGTCGGVTCVRWSGGGITQDDLYWQQGSSSTAAVFYFIGADQYHYNIYHYGSKAQAIAHGYCGSFDTNYCTGGVQYNCSTALPPVGCGGGNQPKKYVTTRHVFLKTIDGTIFVDYTSFHASASTATCWNGSGSCLNFN